MVLFTLGGVQCLYAAQYTLESSVSARAEYHDNIFLTTLPHDSVAGLVVTPQVRLLAKEQDWQTYLNTKFVGNRYSDHDLNSNDLFFLLDSRISQEKNILSVSVAYNKDSSLNTESSDFGVAARRVKSTLTRISPSYQINLSERSSLSFSLSHTAVNYDDNTGTGYIDYATGSISSKLLYAYSAKSTVSATLQYTDYASDNDAFQYQLSVFQVGIQHQFSELWSFNGAVGTSRRSSSNEATQTLDFFGQTITLVQVNDFVSNGVVLDASLTWQLETGDASLKIGRSNTTNSFGGLNEVNSARLSHNKKWTELWRHTLSVRYEDINAVSTGVRTTDRTAVFLEAALYRQISRQWNVNASYRYVKRQFDTVGAVDASSNRLFLGLTYNFPDISTF